VLARAVGRELAWALPSVADEVRAWRAIAEGIPDVQIRERALSALAHKRGHTDGAALFGILPRERNADLLRLLTAYEILWDFLDSVNESAPSAGQINGRQLHLALIDALDPQRPLSDYYLYHPWSRDGGYLRALVGVCRAACQLLPSYERVRRVVVREATRAQVLALNHDPNPACRDAALRAWARCEFPARPDAAWFELSGAASASLTIHVLLALSAESECVEGDLVRTQSVYFPWISAATTMLDSYVDQAEDVVSGDHSYVAHYRTPELAAERIQELIERCFHEVGTLPAAERHTLIVACMTAMYLSKDSAWVESARETSESFIDASGSLTRFLLPILRLWRIAYAQRSS
jgi:tetraprenyl-beta-curcumene synthase